MTALRKTKIILTLGPATQSAEMIGKLVDHGMNIARLNMSHAHHDWVREVVARVRLASKKAGRHVAILMDTQGPAIRTGDLEAPVELKAGQSFTFTLPGTPRETTASVEVNYPGLAEDLNPNDRVLLDNGEIEMRVLEKTSQKIKCEVVIPGLLGNRRHINLPGVKVNLPALTEKDIADVKLGLELGVDFIALSFVRRARDIEELRARTEGADPKPLLVAKIEDQQSVENLNEIILAADGVMVARGDLGIECPYEELPIIQRRVVKLCLKVGRPVIVATHMLESMIENPVPTRAEITDVANAVFEQADAVMLSAETTVGKFPLQCVTVLDKISRRIERSGGANFHHLAEISLPRQKLAKSAVVMADELKAQAIVLFTVRGNMARHVAWMRPTHSPIYAICETENVARALALIWGVRCFVQHFNHHEPEKTIQTALSTLLDQKLLTLGSHIVLITSTTTGKEMIDSVQMRVVEPPGRQDL